MTAWTYLKTGEKAGMIWVRIDKNRDGNNHDGRLRLTTPCCLGWNPVILNPQNAQQLPEYDALMKMIPDDSMLSRDSLPNYRRWMAMAAAGGGWMCDYTVWPLNYFLQHGRVLPYDGAITTYMGASPVLVSGSGDEFRRMVHQIGQTAGKIIDRQKWLNENSPELFRKFVNWNDAVALQELRKNVSKDMFKVRGDVVDRSRLANEDGAFDCNASNGKRAVFFRGLTGNAYENRGTQARKFLNQWRAACGVAQAAELQAAG